MAQRQEMTLSDYVAILRRRWRVAVSVSAIVLFASIYFAFALPATYESSATMLVEQQGIPEDFVQTTVNSYAEERLQNIYQRVLAASNVLAMIDQLDLYPDERNTAPDEELIFEFRDNTLMEPQNVATINARTGRQAIITFGYRIAFRYPDPVKARDVAAELARQFVANSTELRAEAATRTTAFLDVEAARLQRRLADVAGRIAEFKEGHANNLPEDQGVNLQTWERLREELTQIETRVRETRERKALLESELAETPRYRPVLEGSGEPVLGGIDRLAQAQQELIRLRGRYSENHPAIISLRREIQALSSSSANLSNTLQQLRLELDVKQRELDATRETYSENHPDVQALERTVASLRQQISVLEDELASSTARGAQPNNPMYVQLLTRIDSAESELVDLERRRNELTARVNELEQLRAAAPQVEREYTTLMQEQELVLNQYRDLRTLEGEATLGEALETGQSAERLMLVEPARVPASPVSPNRVSLSFLGIVLAIGMGLGVAALVEVFDSTVRGQHDVYQILEMPPMGIIPYVETRRDAIKRVAINAGMAALLLAGAALLTVMVLA